mgnify:CR=1 FL=1
MPHRAASRRRRCRTSSAPATRGLTATGSVKDGERLAPARNAWRDAVRQRLMAVDAQGREAGLAALVLGDGSGLTADDWRVLQDTGTVHLLVISGQHIGLLAGLIYALVAALARYGCWPRTWPWLPWACGLAFTAALGYGLLAGFGGLGFVTGHGRPESRKGADALPAQLARRTTAPKK